MPKSSWCDREKGLILHVSHRAVVFLTIPREKSGLMDWHKDRRISTVHMCARCQAWAPSIAPRWTNELHHTTAQQGSTFQGQGEPGNYSHQGCPGAKPQCSCTALRKSLIDLKIPNAYFIHIFLNESANNVQCSGNVKYYRIRKCINLSRTFYCMCY